MPQPALLQAVFGDPYLSERCKDRLVEVLSVPPADLDQLVVAVLRVVGPGWQPSVDAALALREAGVRITPEHRARADGMVPFEHPTKGRLWRFHEQVWLTEDVHVDEGIAPLVLALWGAGYSTRFSCQGGRFDQQHGRAQVVFETLDEAVSVAGLLASRLTGKHVRGGRTQLLEDMASVDVVADDTGALFGVLWFPTWAIEPLAELLGGHTHRA